MAEFVEKNIQEMVREVEEMERLNILSSDEIKKLIEKRRDLEYKVYGMHKEKQNYVNYVMYEIQLLDLISFRRKKIMMFENISVIEKPIIQRVITRLRMMTRVWPSHIDIWQLRISFAKSRKLYNEVSIAYAEQTQFHGDNENVWIAWAQWEIEGRRNFESARSILLSRAPRYHPNSLSLTREYFRLELLFVECIKRRSKRLNIEGLEDIAKENRKKVLNCGVAEKIFENAEAKFDCPELYLELYSVSKKFNFAKALSDKIIRKLIHRFPEDSAVWGLKAIFILEGRDLSLFGEEGKQLTKAENEAGSHKILNTKLRMLVKLYDRALKSVGLGFLDCIVRDYLKLLDEIWAMKTLAELLTSNLLSIFEDNQEHLTPFQFLIWYEIAAVQKKRMVELKAIVRKAAALHPKCPFIQFKMYQIVRPALAFKEKKKVIEGLSGKIGVDICLVLISRIKKPSAKAKMLERVFSHPNRELCKLIRLFHLQSLSSIEDCRLHYNKYASLPPFDIEFHIAMLKKELMESDISVDIIRKVFENAVSQFGSNEVGLWLAYSEFEKRMGSRKKMLLIDTKSSSSLKINYLPVITDLKFILSAQLEKVQDSTKENEYFVDLSEEDVTAMPEFLKKSTLPCLLKSSVHITLSNLKEKTDFFKRLAVIEKELAAVASPFSEKENRIELWEDILRLICGRKISLLLKKIPFDSENSLVKSQIFVHQADTDFQNNLEKRKLKLSDELRHEDIILEKKSEKSEVEKALLASSVLQPNFQTKKQIAPYFRSRNAIKKERRIKRSKTAGEGWYNMKAVRSQEMKRDMKLLKMRSVWDPKRHYKRSDMKETPKFFQMAKVVDSPFDFYSSRVPKKQRKITLAEEIMNEEKVLQYQKKKYKEIFEKREAKKKKMVKIMRKKKKGGKISNS